MIISGGQVGVDQGALRAARDLGLPTGGWMPKGFLTLAGRDEVIASIYGLQEAQTTKYPERTRLNVGMADITIIIDALPGFSRGNALTEQIASDMGKEFYRHDLSALEPGTPAWDEWIEGWNHCITNPFMLGRDSINIAGNSGRDSFIGRRSAYKKGYHFVRDWLGRYKHMHDIAKDMF